VVGAGDTLVGAGTSFSGVKRTDAIAVQPKCAQPGAGIQVFSKEGNKMKPSTRDEIQGEAHEVEGQG
jgi:hypothetical protein